LILDNNLDNYISINLDCELRCLVFVSPEKYYNHKYDLYFPNSSYYDIIYVPLWEDDEFIPFLEHFNINIGKGLPNSIKNHSVKTIFGEKRWERLSMQDVFGNIPRFFILENPENEMEICLDSFESLKKENYYDLLDCSEESMEEIKNCNHLFQISSDSDSYFGEFHIQITDVVRELIMADLEKKKLKKIIHFLKNSWERYVDSSKYGIFFESSIKKLFVICGFNAKFESVDKRFKIKYIKFNNNILFDKCTGGSIHIDNDNNDTVLEENKIYFPYLNANLKASDMITLKRMNSVYNNKEYKDISCIISIQVTVSKSHTINFTGMENLVERSIFMFDRVDTKNRHDGIFSSGGKNMLPIIHIFILPHYKVYDEFQIKGEEKGSGVNAVYCQANKSNIQVGKMCIDWKNIK
jgi:hypothetical protein